ncbi:MAG: DUF2500 domain-containing protein [Clostridia bacterium]|nr:DUF2500 domain-containing protein [Clostridia bacterium]
MRSPFEILFFAVFLAIFAAFIVLFVKNVAQWHKNNQSPRLTVDAVVAAKRSDTSLSQTPVGGDITGAHGYSTTSSTTCFVTFQFESGDRMELTVPSSEYAMLAEGDRGRLTFQGTRFLSFERTASNF